MLGPTLFSIYMNYLAMANLQRHLMQYKGDTLLLYVGKEGKKKEISGAITKKITNILENWDKINKLK